MIHKIKIYVLLLIIWLKKCLKKKIQFYVNYFVKQFHN